MDKKGKKRKHPVDKKREGKHPLFQLFIHNKSKEKKDAWIKTVDNFKK
jgi:hypothetical protein